jgi:hypothetical protein
MPTRYHLRSLIESLVKVLSHRLRVSHSPLRRQYRGLDGLRGSGSGANAGTVLSQYAGTGSGSQARHVSGSGGGRQWPPQPTVHRPASIIHHPPRVRTCSSLAREWFILAFLIDLAHSAVGLSLLRILLLFVPHVHHPNLEDQRGYFQVAVELEVCKGMKNISYRKTDR